MLRRSLDFRVNSNSFFMWSNFFVINTLMRKEVLQRQDFPLGDEAYTAPLLKAAHGGPVRPRRCLRRCRPSLRPSLRYCPPFRCAPA